jgi:hypothetical protein
MSQEHFQASNWYKGINLVERIISSSFKEYTHEFNADLAQKKIQQWRSQPPFNSDIDSYFSQRLGIDNLNEAQLFYVLGESIESIKARSLNPPKWLIEFKKAFCRSDITNVQCLLPSKLQLNQSDTGFLYVIEPLLSQALEQLQQGIKTLVEQESNCIRSINRGSAKNKK